MSGIKTALSVAAGVVLGGLILGGILAAMMRGPIFGEQTPARKAGLSDREYARRLHDARRTWAKGIGLGIIMWSADHDDRMPTASQLATELPTYVKDAETIAQIPNFIYKDPGKPYTTIENIATTELGRIKDPLGDIVVFTDGHALSEETPSP